MGMSNMILDNVEKFYSECNDIIGSCEIFEQFQMKAKDLEGLLQGAEYELEYLYDNHGYREIWDEYWSKYQ